MQEILVNILIFCGILLLLALTVATVQMVIMLIDVRKVTKEAMEKVKAVMSLLDIVSILFAGLESAKNKIGSKKGTLVGLVAGIKKGLQVLFK